ncbi:MAG: anti-sigma factor antagonist [Patescibacteria group bacterium]
MNIQTERIGDVLIARAEGDLDLSTAGAFREAIDRHLEGADGAAHLVLNMSGLSFIDSSGLGAILGRYRRIGERGGRLVAADVPGHITRLLALSGLQKIIASYTTEAEALRNLQGGGL